LAEIDCVLLLAGGLPLGSCSWDFRTPSGSVESAPGRCERYRPRTRGIPNRGHRGPRPGTDIDPV